MDNIEITNMTNANVDEVSRICNEAYLPEYITAQKLSLETINELLASNSPEQLVDRMKGNYFFVAKDKKSNKIIGLIGLRKDAERPLHDRISTFVVSKEYQGKGVGFALFNVVLDLARKLNVKKLFVKGSLIAEPIYQHWGFKKIKIIETKYPNGDIFKNVWMEKDLT